MIFGQINNMLEVFHGTPISFQVNAGQYLVQDMTASFQILSSVISPFDAM
jgi:hypothetical protein